MPCRLYGLVITTPIYFGAFDPKQLEPADYLLIAGDLGTADNYFDVYTAIKKQTDGKFKDCFFIRGNHDYWTNRGKTIDTNHKYLEQTLGENVVLLGCTMWTPIREYRPNAGERWATSVECTVHRRMNDYRCIPNFSIKKNNALFREESAWLRDKVKQYAGYKIVIMTHTGPRKELVSYKYDNNCVNAAYFVLDNSCDDINPALWISGHTHEKFDTIIGDTRFVCNPIGYHDIDRYSVIPECPVTNWYNNIVSI